MDSLPVPLLVLAGYLSGMLVTAFTFGRVRPDVVRYLGHWEHDDDTAMFWVGVAGWPVGLPLLLVYGMARVGQVSTQWHLPAAWRKMPAGADGWHEHVDGNMIVRWKERAS